MLLCGNGRGRDEDYSSPPAQIPACAANAPGSSLGSNVGKQAVWARSRSNAQPPVGSTWYLGSMSEPRSPVGCFPRVRPFPPRPPREVAFLCSVASSVLRPHPTLNSRRFNSLVSLFNIGSLSFDRCTQRPDFCTTLRLLAGASSVRDGSSAPFGRSRRALPLCPNQRTLSQAVETTELCHKRP